MAVNPFTITFGKEPNKIIARYEDIDRIVSDFNSENPVSQTFIIEGIRGSGKTVLMTTVAKTLSKDKSWIVVNLNPAMELLPNLAMRLNDACNRKPELLSKGFNISAAGFGIGVNGEDNSFDHVGMIDKCFKNIKKKRKKVIITIDEVVHNENMRIFASQYQIFVRQDYPVFLIMTGLYENLYAVQNDPALTFLLRCPRITTGPLSLLQITKQYAEIFGISDAEANKLAGITKGYAFAFQALGVSYWNNGSKGMTEVLGEFDELLDDFVYKKVWSLLTKKERDIVCAVSEKEVKTGEICKRLSMSSSTFSKYRDNLIQKGILTSPEYGYVSLSLPRFYEVVRNYGE